MRKLCSKKMGNVFAILVFMLIVYACAEMTEVYQTGESSAKPAEADQNIDGSAGSAEVHQTGDSSTETDSRRSETKTSRMNQQPVPVKKISPYQVPPEEIAERIAYGYAYDNRIYHIADYDYKLLSFLPAGEDITISVYTVEGNKILFLPEEKANTDALVNGERCRLHYSEEAGGFVFYVLVDWQLSENGVPVNALEDNYDSRIRECIVYAKGAVQKEVDYRDSPIPYLYKFGLEDLVKLGDVKVNFDPEEIMEFQKIPVENNAYLNAVKDFAAEILREKQTYGKFQICLETYGRVPGTYGAYTEAKVSAAVVGEGMEEYLFFTINDNGSVTEERVWPEYYPSLADDPGYFVASWYLKEQPANFIPEIMELQREVIELEVREEENQGEGTGHIFNEGECNQEIDFRAMSLEGTSELINDAYSYEEWFGMNELGCQTGELRGLQDEEIVMYSWDNNGDKVFFVPKCMANTRVACENRENCPMYVDRYGDMEFYTLERNGYAKETGQLKTTFFMEEYLSMNYAEHLLYLGEAKLTLRDLSLTDVPKTGEDAYIRAFTEYIEDVLRQNGRSGEYEISIGEYEALHENKVCLSAAVSGGEESWYFRDLVVNTGDETYAFWPVGFGLNGSLEECRAESHDMNALCIERTKCLERNRCVIEVENEHTVLSYNICSSPKYDYENTPLAAYIEEAYVAETEEMSKRTGNDLTLEIDYHRFDFNDDGVEDYLLCVWGSLYCGSGGNTVEIYVQEEGGVRKVLDIITRLHSSLSDHGMFTVLDEKTNGYYAIVLPESNYILRYDAKKGEYDFRDLIQ